MRRSCVGNECFTKTICANTRDPVIRRGTKGFLLCLASPRFQFRRRCVPRLEGMAERSQGRPLPSCPSPIDPRFGPSHPDSHARRPTLAGEGGDWGWGSTRSPRRDPRAVFATEASKAGRHGASRSVARRTFSGVNVSGRCRCGPGSPSQIPLGSRPL